MTRSDPAVQIAGVTVVMQAVFYLSCLVDAASPSSLETLRAHRDQRAAQGKDPATVASETEIADPVFTGWDRQQQTIWGTVIAGVGVPAFVS